MVFEWNPIWLQYRGSRVLNSAWVRPIPENFPKVFFPDSFFPRYVFGVRRVISESDFSVKPKLSKSYIVSERNFWKALDVDLREAQFS